jgi:hypothetical protein
MRYFKFQLLILLLISFCSIQKVNFNKPEDSDKEEIQKLIRQALSWANSNNSFELLPAIADKNDSLYIGFDFEKLKRNLIKLEEIKFFSRDFIENYHRIILTIDTKIKTKEFGDWEVGEMQPFSFSYDINPWCYCQEIPENNPWNRVDINIIKINNKQGELTWSWAKSDWTSGDFKNYFKVIKEDGRWKIDYLAGFDYDESIKKE